MKIINLSIVTQVVNEEGEKILQRATSNKPKTVGEGLTKEWFIDQNIEVPKELLEDEIERDENGLVILDDKHLEYEETFCAIPIKNIDSWFEHENIGTIVNTNSGNWFHVFEEVDEITDYINYLNTPQYKKWWVELKILYRRLTNKNKLNT